MIFDKEDRFLRPMFDKGDLFLRPIFDKEDQFLRPIFSISPTHKVTTLIQFDVFSKTLGVLTLIFFKFTTQEIPNPKFVLISQIENSQNKVCADFPNLKDGERARERERTVPSALAAAHTYRRICQVLCALLERPFRLACQLLCCSSSPV